MSDGYADDGYSAYSSSPEWFWNDDVEPTQADDLAEHTLPSPIWDEDRWYLNETYEHHSDWEYYSDDYFDQKAPIPNEEIRQKDSKSGPLPSDHQIEQHRDKRVKHSESSILCAQNSIKGRSIRGVVYRYTTVHGDTVDGNHEPDNIIYEPGKSGKEALFEDWRKTFYNSRPEREVKKDMNCLQQPRSPHQSSEDGNDEEEMDIAPSVSPSDLETTWKDPAEHQTQFSPHLEKARPYIQAAERDAVVDVEPGGKHDRDA